MTASLRLFLPRDTTALALGADRVAAALAREAASRGLPVELVRNGSRGLFWLEPLLEADLRGERVAFGPVDSASLPSILAALAANPGNHPLYLGPVEEIPYLKSQQRLTFARAGQGNPLCLDSYRKLAGFSGLERALRLDAQDIVTAVTESGLRGRGGAGFPTGLKWRMTRATPSDQRYIICNGDEGDPGAFMDRGVLESDPHSVLEGMIIGAYAMGASVGYFYTGGAVPESILLGSGFNQVSGLAGNDLIIMQEGASGQVDGGAGRDVFSLRGLEVGIGKARQRLVLFGERREVAVAAGSSP